MILYGDARSGNCYKCQLISALIGIEYQWQDIDIMMGDTQKPDFMSKNPLGKIPILELDDGKILSESNAIINYLAQGTSLYPADPWQQALIQQWQFFEQYSHEPYIAVARFIQLYQGMPDERLEEYQRIVPRGYQALDHLENALYNALFLCGDTITTADVSLFAYTHVAHEGGFDLSRYPNILQWIKRIKATPSFIPMHV